jgi:hypothetical protein
MIQRCGSPAQSSSIVRKVHELLGNKLLESNPFKTGGSTDVFQSTLIVGQMEKPVVLKVWREECILTSMALNLHNNYLALQRLKTRNLIRTAHIPIIYYSFVETEDGNLILLPADKYIEDVKRPPVGAVKNQLMVVQDISLGGKFEIKDGMYTIASDQTRGVLADFDTLADLIGGDLNSIRTFLSLTPITVMDDPRRTYLADIDKIKRIPYVGPLTIDLADLIEKTGNLAGAKTNHSEKRDEQH